jgi:hypothetical protein
MGDFFSILDALEGTLGRGIHQVHREDPRVRSRIDLRKRLNDDLQHVIEIGLEEAP